METLFVRNETTTQLRPATSDELRSYLTIVRAKPIAVTTVDIRGQLVSKQMIKMVLEEARERTGREIEFVHSGVADDYQDYQEARADAVILAYPPTDFDFSSRANNVPAIVLMDQNNPNREIRYFQKRVAQEHGVVAFLNNPSAETTLEVLAKVIRQEKLPSNWSNLATSESIGLSETEIEVLAMLVSGMKPRQIADAKVVEYSTIRTHTQHIYQKLGVHSALEAIAKAKELGLMA